MSDVHPNMAVLKPSRKKPVAGDIFAVSYPTRGYVFGRVVFADIATGPMGPGSILIYVYSHVGKAATDFSDDQLKPDRLLLPPMFINRLPWSRGYFYTVRSTPITPADLLERHCFISPTRRRLVDLDGVEVAERAEPCGVYALQSCLTIDDAISGALGIPPAPA